MAGEIDRLLALRGLRADQVGVYRGAAWGTAGRRGLPLPSDPLLQGTAYHYRAHIPNLSGPGSHVHVAGQPRLSDPTQSADSQGERPEEGWHRPEEVAEGSVGAEAADAIPGSSPLGVLPLSGALPADLQEDLAGLVRLVEESEKVQKQQRKQVRGAHTMLLTRPSLVVQYLLYSTLVRTPCCATQQSSGHSSVLLHRA